MFLSSLVCRLDHIVISPYVRRFLFSEKLQKRRSGSHLRLASFHSDQSFDHVDRRDRIYQPSRRHRDVMHLASSSRPPFRRRLPVPIDHSSQSTDQPASLSRPDRSLSSDHDQQAAETLDPSSVSLSHLERLVSRGKYLTTERIDDQKNRVQFSREFIDFLISWCNGKCEAVDQGRLDSVDAALCVANVIHSMKATLKQLKKRNKPRGKCLVEMSRLYSHGLQKLAERSENVEAEPSKVNRILCQYADACCNFDFDPSASDVDLWPFWYRVAKFYLEEVDSDANWRPEREDRKKPKQGFTEAYAYLLSIIIDVTLRFRRTYEFGSLKFAWESRLASHVSNFTERNSYILSLRMANLAQQHGLEFDHIVAKQLMIRGIQRSFDEYQFRKGLGSKPSRTVQDLLQADSTK